MPINALSGRNFVNGRPERETLELVTLGHIRSHGCRDLLVYCGSMNCNHGVMNAGSHAG